MNFKAFDPFKLADQGFQWQGTVALATLPRIAELVLNPEQVVRVALTFGRDVEKQRYIQAHYEAEVVQVCQRCGQPVRIVLNFESWLAPIISDKQATSLPKRYEPLLTDGEPVQLIDMIDEDLLLSLPMTPKHPIDDDGICIT